MDNGFVFRAPKCINPENFIKIRALLESRFAKIYQYPRFLHLMNTEYLNLNISRKMIITAKTQKKSNTFGKNVNLETKIQKIH
jgi:hypothetical protein